MAHGGALIISSQRTRRGTGCWPPGTILEEFEVGALWMLRPWLYAGEIIARFDNFISLENLQRRLKDCYPNIAALEEIALRQEYPDL